VFGDPFQGAKIKGYNGEIVTYCNAGDYVCTGNFEISASHLSYSTGAATSQFNRLAAAYHSRKGGVPVPAAATIDASSGGDAAPATPKGPKGGKGKGSPS
jgi:hypothetical protein